MTPIAFSTILGLATFGIAHSFHSDAQDRQSELDAKWSFDVCFTLRRAKALHFLFARDRTNLAC